MDRRKLIKDYLSEREAVLKGRWFTFASWWRRTLNSTRYDEVTHLLDIEDEFNRRWQKRMKSELATVFNKAKELESLKLLLKTNKLKHEERGIYLVIVVAIFVSTMQMFDNEMLLKLFGLFIVGLLVAYERVFSSLMGKSLEELALMIDLAINDLPDDNSDK